MEEQNFGNEGLENQNTGAVKAVDAGEVEKLQLNEEIENFFAERMAAPEMEQAEQILKERAEAEEDVDVYSILSEKYEAMKAEGKKDESVKLLAAALDLAEIAEKGGIKLAFNLEDFEKVRRLIAQAHKEYAAGQLTEQNFKISCLIISRYVEFIVLMQDEPNEYYLVGLEQKIAHAIKTGDLSVLRF